MSTPPNNTGYTPTPQKPPRPVEQVDGMQPRHAKAAPAKKKKGPIIALSILLVLLLCGVAAGAGYLIWQQAELDRVAQEMKDTPIPEIEIPPADVIDPLPNNPVDFPALKLENSDIYAWIHIPNTDVNLPVLQSLVDDNFYLDKNRNKEYAVEGSIYSQMINNTDFSDPVTLLYGHNLINGTMFSTLHYFENEEFFNANETMYIYTPGHILTYQIVSAYIFDDRHIMNSYDFSDPAVLQDYFSMVTSPDSMLVNTREGVELSIDDKIVQLSTCLQDTYHGSNRFIVTGVLIDDQPTH